MPNAPPPAATRYGLRLSRATHRTRLIVAADAPTTTTEGLARHGLTHRPPPSHSRSPLRRVVFALGGADLGLADYREGRLLAQLLDLRVPRAAALAIALVACVAPEVEVTSEPTPTPEVYAAEQEATTERFLAEVHAEARCAPGDVVLGGGCSWGARRSPERAYPLEVIEDRPSDDGAGWLCVGQQDGVGVELEVLRASAVCLVQGGVS